ncbi:electron transfer flavoprotein subunit beta/FixA family protein [Caballeronia sp. LZ033]|uniref:electron transfer flavoprotein subunit beta/FixA family protein n=1 Tax=Caballeronia sp. LZ033 TaxID=3038566 RepID=UPI00285959EE|nr:electron transfer flavoprotein subunit beta/FixA family protein [Caballeronia sp. LZ033]MDR5818579.1 electron transfer flavoprotein subunit beta/FixA family protein [Caballeronia sp. LZ033]
MKIAVLVSTGRHPVSGTARYSRNDAAALTIAIGIARAQGAQLDVLHAGDPANPALAEYLALGAPKVEVLNTEGDACAALAQRLSGYHLVFTGTRAEGAYDSGTLPYKLADALNLPLVGAAVDVSVTQDGVEVRQFMPKGLRRRVRAPLPALVAVHPLANAVPRYAYARLREGQVAPVASVVAADKEKAAWTVRPAGAKPKKLAAPEKRSGHSRMLSATTTESRGGSVVIEGSSVEKAQVILAYLREHQLVDY